ncbi:Lsm family RNA-binding protein [Candidatus Bathyarchaeota archaeon]|nr:Lsm family RNA-binding protein [Candidatus Bathyarchaeota archaeon]MBS7617043.1 Lsm family RNA-binding protein [Candidatus Bathyarchaeota archaeon]
MKMSLASRSRFAEEAASLLNKTVTVITVDGKRYTGILTGVDPDKLNLSLRDARDEKGTAMYRLIINGVVIAQIYTSEKPLNLRNLAERLERVFPRLVKLYEDQGVIVVMDKIRVTEKGIVEGSGPAAERVQKVYEEFIREATG